MKIVKIIGGVLFAAVGLIGCIQASNAPNNLLAGIIGMLIAAWLFYSAFRVKKVKYPCIENRTIKVNNNTQIAVDKLFGDFGSDRIAVQNYLTSTFQLKSTTAQWIVLSIYRDYYKTFLDWHSTRKINAFVEIDDNLKRIGIKSPYTKPKWEVTDVFHFDEILSYELYDNGKIVTKGGLGSAVVGGALFGGVGAVVGSNVGKKTSKVSDYSIKITLKNVNSKPIFIKGIQSRETGEEIISALDQLVNQSTETASVSSSNSADEILKYKNLLDMGAITQEEFDAKKKELLGL
jgi:hypothetical protein